MFKDKQDPKQQTLSFAYAAWIALMMYETLTYEVVGTAKSAP